MILLEAHSLNYAGMIGDINENLIKKERDCTAAWTPQRIDGLGTDIWLKDETKPGAGIIWRIQSIRQVFGTDINTVNLEHVINTLKDKIIFGAVTAKEITGNQSATTCTARQALEYILNKQSDWVLDEFDYESVSNPYKFDGETLYEAIEKVSDTLEDAWWSFDLTVYPFKLSITEKQEDVGTEMRANRNLISIEKTIDRNGMYTRFYPIGKDDLHITGEYVEKNASTYGVREKEEVDQTLETEAELIAWANERLDKHAEPSVNIVVDGLELSSATEQELDEINMGMICRVPLPEYSTTILERIIEMNYPDAVNSPEVVKITLANNKEDVTKIIADAIKRGGGGRRAAGRQAKEDHAWFEDTNNHVAMCAEGIVGVDAQGNPNWVRLSQIIADENGIDTTVQSIQGDVVLAFSEIEQTESRIHIEVADVLSNVHSFIEQTPDMIHSEVSTAVSGIAHSVIEQTATYIRTEVANAASAITETVIEQTVEYVRTEVSNVASGVAWTVVQQTMTNIVQEVNKKSKVYIQLSDPNDGTNVLREGDIWIKAEENKTWNANAGSTWNSQNTKQWRSKYGDKHYVWRSGAWVLDFDTSDAVESSVKIEQTDRSLAIIAQETTLDGQEYISRLEQTAQRIRSEVSTSRSQTYSIIQQTATSIRSEVASTTSNVRSLIQQESNRISLVVEGTGANAHIKPAAIIASINGGSSTIKLSADHIDIDGVVSKLSAKDVMIANLNATDGEFIGNLRVLGESGIRSYGPVEGTKGDFDALQIGEHNVSWKSKTVVTSVTRGNSRNFVYAVNGNISNLSTLIGTLVTGVTTDSIYYLGR